jgi:hypothetical protein
VLKTVDKLAVPLARFAMPSEAVPLENVTVPPGTPAAELTVAVRTSLAPTAIEDEASVRVVVVGIAVTVTATGALVEAVLLESPMYWTVRLWVPGTLSVTDELALAVAPEEAAITAPEAITVVPSRKLIAPVGTAFVCAPVTVAVNVVLEPACTDEGETVSTAVVAVEYGETVALTLPNE